jgi:Ca2+-binding EF-hand superfamily protein
VIRERLDAKSFFQDHDRHNHFKVSPKQFKQILTLLKCPIDDSQVRAITRVYGNKQGDVEYLRFLADAECLNLGRALEGKGTKTTYVPVDTDFSGAKDMGILLGKIKEFVFRHRIRLGEFFQDHDPLRKGVIDATKFRTTLYAQKLQLTHEEYAKLEDFFRDPENAQKIRYFDFNEEIEKIFTEKDLEKCPTKHLSEFKVPSILDPRNQLTRDEESELHEIMTRIGTDVKHRRLLIKPFFQDKDKSKSGFVTNTRFRSIFDNQKLWITDREYSLINKRFQAAAANEINYVEFDHVLRLYSGDRE